MKKEVKRIVKELVNKNCPCENCILNYLCEYWDGDESVECTANDFVDGVQATLKHLASIPWNEAMDIIDDSVKEDEE